MLTLNVRRRLLRRLIGIVAILISFFVFGSCDDRNRDIIVVWEGEKAVAIDIPPSVASTQNPAELKVRLISDGERGEMLGDFGFDEGYIQFSPIVPFTRGRKYEVLYKDQVVGTFSISQADVKPPKLLAIYPTQDTIPENLLKIYLEFSASMVEGHSLSYITLIRNKRDTMKGTFLDLSPELWNTEGTVFTLWLDPGRIKRDLIPNKELGAPLVADANYMLVVSGHWKSKDGFELGSDYIKNFTTTFRDERSPNPDNWDVMAPKAGSIEPLVINLYESLDYSLLNEVMRIFRPDRSIMLGGFYMGEEERTISFKPAQPWIKGAYEIWIEPRLEDLAGNNLNRPFDRDLKANKNTSDKLDFRRTFIVE